MFERLIDMTEPHIRKPWAENTKYCYVVQSASVKSGASYADVMDTNPRHGLRPDIGSLASSDPEKRLVNSQSLNCHRLPEDGLLRLKWAFENGNAAMLKLSFSDVNVPALPDSGDLVKWLNTHSDQPVWNML